MGRAWVFGMCRAWAVLCLVAAGVAPADAAVRLAEKDVNLDEALRLASMLRERGFRVLLTRERDVYVPLGERTRAANEAGADLFVSVHNNASANRRLEGTEVYHQIESQLGAELARRILAEVSARAATRARGVFARRGQNGDYYFVLRNSRMPAVIVEGAYLSNPREARRLADPAFRQRVAEGIAAAVASVLPPPRVPEPDFCRPAPVGASRPSPTGQQLEAPPLRVERLGATGAVVRWDTVRGATGYRLWRDGTLIREIRTSTDKVPLLQVLGQDPSPRTIEVVERDLAVGNHCYEVRAFSEVLDSPWAESGSRVAGLRIPPPPPPLVAVDAGHGGADSGAVGRF